MFSSRLFRVGKTSITGNKSDAWVHAGSAGDFAYSNINATEPPDYARRQKMLDWHRQYLARTVTVAAIPLCHRFTAPAIRGVNRCSSIPAGFVNLRCLADCDSKVEVSFAHF